MALVYQTPGVYVEEVSTGSRAISAVSTSVAAFLGLAPKADAFPNQARAVNNWAQFQTDFCADGQPGTDLARAVFGFFNNGGSRCYIVNLGDGPLAGDARKRSGLEALREVDEVAIVAAPGYTDPADHDAVLTFCEGCGDRVAILDAPAEVDSIDQLKQVARVGADGAVVPGSGLRPRSSEGGYGAFYFPWIRAQDPLATRRSVVVTPPSGHVAGVYARTDAVRGVHKAPANEQVRGALDLTYNVTRDEQGELNELGVNCIRFFPNAGILIWGARTLAASSSEWRYVPIRRLFNMIKESIAGGTRWAVFEPNDLILRGSLVRSVSGFLYRLHRDGALAGATPAQAYFVKCDDENNPPEIVDAGRIVIEVGIAPKKPAEFIIFRIGQWAGGVEVETASAGGA